MKKFYMLLVSILLGLSTMPLQARPAPQAAPLGTLPEIPIFRLTEQVEALPTLSPYEMVDSQGNQHQFAGTDLTGDGKYDRLVIDGVTYWWDKTRRYYATIGATPPDFSRYEFYPDGNGGYTYAKKVEVIGTYTIEIGTLTQS